MSFHCQLHSRLYSDKAVQTESPMAAIRGTDSSGAVLWSGTADLAINELLSRSGGAYRRSTPALSRGPVNDKTWLDYNHPSGDSRGVQRRVVSHPESVTCEPKTPHSDSGRLRVVSLPELKSCVSVSKYLERRSPGNREYPSDLPRTPSPPSSPDSVIVENETRVPSSFFQPYVGENGWTTWANSPPRPIPALHGPSSLPYARCPSGAEGTIVEGGDLATKVWGLGFDEGHRFRSPRPLRPSASCAPLPLDFHFDYQTVTSSALAHHRDSVIDLVKPSTFYCYPEAYDSTGGRLVVFDGMYSSPAGRPNLRAHTRSYHMHSANVTTASTIDCPDQASGTSNLNSAAPSFVPACPIGNTDSERACVQQDAEYSEFAYTHTGDSGQQRTSNSDLTPTSTASPLWSPFFQSIPTIVLGDHDPRIYSPRTDLEGHYNKSITPQLTSQDFMIVPQAEQNMKSSIETFYAQRHAANSGICTTGANAVGATHSHTVTCGLSEANRVESCERRGHLPHHQPRSIQMARLMQRRLSSVVEEENISSSCNLSRAREDGG